MTLFRVQAPHFVAGGEITGDRVGPWLAPILSYMRGWAYTTMVLYCRRKGWAVEAWEGTSGPDMPPACPGRPLESPRIDDRS